MRTLLDEIVGIDQKDAYDGLPESIKGMYDRKAWMWLTDAEKINLVRNECVPEVFDD